MALVALTTADQAEYVSNLDPSKKMVDVQNDPNDPAKGTKKVAQISDGASVFMLRNLDVFLKGYIYDNASSLSGEQDSNKIGIQTRVNQTNIDAVRHGLIGIKNFADKLGNAVVYATQKVVVNGRPYIGVSDAVMNTLGIQLIQELAEKIKKMSEVTAAEEKNSEEASQQSA